MVLCELGEEASNAACGRKCEGGMVVGGGGGQGGQGRLSGKKLSETRRMHRKYPGNADGWGESKGHRDLSTYPNP